MIAPVFIKDESLSLTAQIHPLLHRRALAFDPLQSVATGWFGEG
jgi:hypothetical protein